MGLVCECLKVPAGTGAQAAPAMLTANGSVFIYLYEIYSLPTKIHS